MMPPGEHACIRPAADRPEKMHPPTKLPSSAL
jgi:hypothetical protein